MWIRSKYELKEFLPERSRRNIPLNHVSEPNLPSQFILDQRSLYQVSNGTLLTHPPSTTTHRLVTSCLNVCELTPMICQTHPCGFV